MRNWIFAAALLGAVSCAPRPAPTTPAPTTRAAVAAVPAPKAGDIWINSVGMKLAYIPAGEFVMGSPTQESGRSDDERQHRVRLTRSFMMGTTLVTQGQWKAVMGSAPSQFTRDDSLPVEQVSWDQAMEFCRELSREEGRQYRLPTESRWEYACRAGTTTAYHTGDDENALHEAGWYVQDSDHKTHPVGQKRANAWGLYDMHGNVWEWCADWYGDYPAGDATDPAGPAQGLMRVARGGSWIHTAAFCRSAFRSYFTPDIRYCVIGFRVCLDVR